MCEKQKHTWAVQSDMALEKNKRLTRDHAKKQASVVLVVLVWVLKLLPK